jgi:hypothetical protein
MKYANKLDSNATFDMFQLISQTLPSNSSSKNQKRFSDFDTDEEFRNDDEIISKKKMIPGKKNIKINRKKNSKAYTCNNNFWAYKKGKKTILVGIMSGSEMVTINDFGDIKSNDFKEITEINLSHYNDFLIVVLDFKKVLLFQLKMKNELIKLPEKMSKYWDSNFSKLNSKISMAANADYHEIPCGDLNYDKSILSYQQLSGKVVENSRISKFVWSELEKCYYYSTDKDIKKLQFKPNFFQNSKKPNSFSSKYFFSDSKNIKTFDLNQKSRIIVSVNIQNEISYINRRGILIKSYQHESKIINLKCFSNSKGMNGQENVFSKANKDFDNIDLSFGFKTKDICSSSCQTEENVMISPSMFEYVLFVFESKNLSIVNIYDNLYLKQDETSLSTEEFFKTACEGATQIFEKNMTKMFKNEIKNGTHSSKKNWYKEYKDIYKNEIVNIKTNSGELFDKKIDQEYENFIKRESTLFYFKEKLWDQTKIFVDNDSIFVSFLREKVIIKVSLLFSNDEINLTKSKNLF